MQMWTLFPISIAHHASKGIYILIMYGIKLWIHFWSLNFNYVSDIYFDMSVFFSKRSRFRISSQFSKIAFSSCFIIYCVPTVFRGLQLMLKTQAVCSDQTVIWKQCLYIWPCPQFSAYTLVLLKGPQHTDMMCVLVFNIIHSFVSSLNPHLLRICSVQSPMWSSRDIQMKTTWPFSNKGVIFWDIIIIQWDVHIILLFIKWEHRVWSV